MNLRQYLTTMIIASAMCWIAWVFVIQNIDPFSAPWWSFGFFYASLFFALLGSVSLIIFSVYHILKKDDTPLFRHVQASFRQSCVISLSIVILLFLQGMQYLTIWNSIILAGIFILAISLSFSMKHRAISQ